MTSVFFYGLFMDEALLKDKGFHPTKPVLGYVEGYGLKIGERATLVKSTGQRAYGSIMALNKGELGSLYGESSVADYLPEEIIVTTFKNVSLKVVVYNLPLEKLAGQNKQYAQLLAKTATEVGLPKEYIQEIEVFAK